MGAAGLAAVVAASSAALVRLGYPLAVVWATAAMLYIGLLDFTRHVVVWLIRQGHKAEAGELALETSLHSACTGKGFLWTSASFLLVAKLG